MQNCLGRLEFIFGGWCMNDEAATHGNSIHLVIREKQLQSLQTDFDGLFLN